MSVQQVLSDAAAPVVPLHRRVTGRQVLVALFVSLLLIGALLLLLRPTPAPTTAPDHEQALGPHHPHTLTTRNNIAHWTGELGDLGAAIDLYRSIAAAAAAPHAPDRTQVVTAAVAAAMLVVQNDLLERRDTARQDMDVLELLYEVAFNRNAAAFAQLPLEVRSLLKGESGSG